uniref:Reverse transcriptase domain-containing protein n=1 Tax=Trichuris muris TaxID=70415 RepID=A0A5S6QLT0_TRIMR
MINITKWLRYTTNFASPELFCLPKIHKEDVPLRPVIASGQCVTSYLCSYLATILKPLTGHRRSHTENSLSFATEIKQIELQDSDILVSYDVTDLFTSIPLDLTYQIISELLSNDVSLNERTKLNPYHITKLVKFCMEDGNYFHWKGSFYSQKRGAPMGSSLSPIIAEIFMEHLEEVAFPTGFQNFHLKAFKRYVDDVFAIVEEGKDRDLLEHLNSLFLGKILFTMEKETGGQLPFFDLLVMREENRMTTKVYRKPTHSGRYLNFLSNHPLNVKVGIITGMVDRAVNLCSREYFNEELEHIRRTLQQNDFPKRLADTYIDRRLNNPRGNLTASEQRNDPNDAMVLPYFPGIGEAIRKESRKLGFKVFFKNFTNLRSFLRSDKVKISPENKPGAIYSVNCSCGASYIGETGHTVAHRFQQHIAALKRYRNAEKRQRGELPKRRGRPQTRDPAKIMEESINASAVVQHVVSCCNPLDQLTATRLHYEPNFSLRKIKEAMYIRHNNCINRDEGVGVSDIWSTVVNATQCCKDHSVDQSPSTSRRNNPPDDVS